MNSKFFIGILLLAAGILAGWFILGRGSVSTPTVRTPEKNILPTSTQKTKSTTDGSEAQQGEPVEKGGVSPRSVVTYTDTGFSPSPLRVSKGDTVTFVNESSHAMQVASAVYPTHQILPSFVQKNTVGKGGIFEYTFTTVGTWKYQNDTLPQDSGSIVVSMN